jgi:hypothetical protein
MCNASALGPITSCSFTLKNMTNLLTAFEVKEGAQHGEYDYFGAGYDKGECGVIIKDFYEPKKSKVCLL